MLGQPTNCRASASQSQKPAAESHVTTDEARQIIVRQYEQVLRREPDASGLATYTKALVENGRDEQWLHRTLAGSPEAQSRAANQRRELLRAGMVSLAVLLVVLSVILRRKILDYLSPALRLLGIDTARIHKAAKFSWLAGAGVFLALALRQHLFVSRYAVNVMFFDQWDFYGPIFENKGWWAVFTKQHGGHRQGIGFLLTDLHAHLSHWNTRWDAFAVSFTIICAALLAAWLLVKSGIRRGPALAAAAVVYLNIRQYEIYLNAPNLSPQAMPILLLTAIACCWFVKSPLIRLPLVGVLTFQIIFSGYGLFAGLIVPCMVLVEAVQACREKDRRRFWLAGGALLIIATGWAIFSRDYMFTSGIDGFRFPYERPLEYAWFAALMLANYHGLPGHAAPTILIGLVICAGLGATCAWHGWRLVRNGVEKERVSAAIFSLSAYAVANCAATSMGRVSLGLAMAPAASRYVTLLIPAGVAIFMQLSLYSGKKAGLLAGAYILLLAVGTIGLRGSDWGTVHWFHNGQQAWKTAYLETHDELQANQRAGFPIYPKPGVITGRLQYLEQHRLNLFAPGEAAR